MNNGNKKIYWLIIQLEISFIFLDFRLIKQLCRQTRFINGTDPTEEEDDEEEEEEPSVDTLNSFE